MLHYLFCYVEDLCFVLLRLPSYTECGWMTWNLSCVVHVLTMPHFGNFLGILALFPWHGYNFFVTNNSQVIRNR